MPEIGQARRERSTGRIRLLDAARTYSMPSTEALLPPSHRLLHS